MRKWRRYFCILRHFVLKGDMSISGEGEFRLTDVPACVYMVQKPTEI